MNYKDTINLPKTSFSMKANLKEKEPKFLKYWEDIKLYEKLQKREGETFILHDGPPYANGNVHLGTALNKILKDFVLKYKSMRGYRCPFIPGWDCHGMPIEHEVTKSFGEKWKDISKLERRKKCKDYADKFINVQREEFKRLGVIGDWQNPYITMSPRYEAKILDVFKKLVEKGYIYRANKPIYWCPVCETALAEAEVEYREREDPSIYVRFPMEKGVSLLIWTTTPWTLPANVAVAVKPDIDYEFVEYNGHILVIAAPLREKVLGDVPVIKKVKGKSLSGKHTGHPIFEDRISKIVTADFVTMEMGTGCVHIAPGHGEEDYRLGREYNLEVLSPVNEKGIFTADAGPFAGKYVFDANKDIIEFLKNKGLLVKEEKITHSYPHCWRCKNPLIFRASPQWFLDIEHLDLRKRCLDILSEIKWIPKWGFDRMRNSLLQRPDWCLSRQRAWGVPLPILYCKNCGEPLLDVEVIDRTIRIVETMGTDAWFHLPPEEIAQDKVCKKCGAKAFVKEEDVFDVWFDSSSSFNAVCKEDLKYPADIYLEAVDQHRGWFQLSLILSVATDGKTPFKTCITHGLVLDKEYRKMSKSLGNVVSPMEVVEKYGADILRLYFASVDYTKDLPFDMEVVDKVAIAYRKIRNTFKYLLGNLHDFDPQKDKVEYDNLMEIDKYMLHKLQKVIKEVLTAYDKFDFAKVYSRLLDFVNYLSWFYFDILKDRLYTYGKDWIERRSAQTVLYDILLALVKLYAPLMPFTTEEVWQHLKISESVHLELLPEPEDKFINEELEKEWEIIESVRDDVLKALEIKRKEKFIGNSLEARIKIEAKNEEVKSILENKKEFLPEVFIVSQVEIGEVSNVVHDGENVKVGVEHALGKKCERCWIYSETVGKDKEYPTICSKCVKVIKGVR